MSEQFRYNPFTGQLDIAGVSVAPEGSLNSLSGNDDVKVFGDTSGNISFIGDETQGVSVSNVALNEEEITVANATTSSKGVSSFNPQNFTVVDGQVSLIGNLISRWINESADFPAVPGIGYFCSGTITSTLPASPIDGNTISFLAVSAGILTIQANTGQYLRNAMDISVETGIAQNNEKGDSIELVYREADSTWYSFTASGGTWSLT